jgi:nucleotide-binding universal stress UspA family protein
MHFERILVPVAGTNADSETMEFACNLAKSSNASIFIVHVIPIDRSLPLDVEVEVEISSAEQLLTQAEDMAKNHGFDAETDLLQAREAGPAIVDEAVERDVDLIIIGLTYKTRFGEYCLGDVVPFVLQNAPCRVILYHQRSVV